MDQNPQILTDSEELEVIELRPARADLNVRLDKYVAANMPDLSRSYVQTLIEDGHIRVDGQIRRTSFKVTPGQLVTIEVPPVEVFDVQPQDIPLDIIHEDDDILIINKPAGMVVHPAPGHPDGTLVNAVLFHAPNISIQGSTRPGIVHRLDKDTSGVMVVAKSDRAQLRLVTQWQAHEVGKKYIALVAGVVEEEEATVDAPIGRHAVNRQEMTTTRQGRDAVTHFQVAERLNNSTLLDVQIDTGRTHQIRVHLAFVGHPVIGDHIYGSKTAQTLASELGLTRQFLHAASLSFDHPGTGERVTYSAPLPTDLTETLEALREHEDSV